jgi:hypothetical protein
MAGSGVVLVKDWMMNMAVVMGIDPYVDRFTSILKRTITKRPMRVPVVNLRNLRISLAE